MFLLLKELSPPDGLPARTHPLGRGVFNETPCSRSCKISATMYAAKTMSLVSLVSSVGRQTTTLLQPITRKPMLCRIQQFASEGRSTTLRRVKDVSSKSTLKEKLMAPAGDSGWYLLCFTVSLESFTSTTNDIH